MLFLRQCSIGDPTIYYLSELIINQQSLFLVDLSDNTQITRDAYKQLALCLKSFNSF